MIAAGVLTFVLVLTIALTWKQIGKIALALGLVLGMALGAMVSEPVLNTADRFLGAGINAAAQIGR